MKYIKVKSKHQTNNQSNMHIFTLEGNIGAGKSTLLKQLEHIQLDKKHVILLEPVDTWMSIRPEPDQPSIFEMYYKDPERYGFMFQMLALQTRMEFLYKIIKDHPTDTVVICERCFLTDFEVFAKMLLDDKIINNAEMHVYKQWYNFLLDIIKPSVKGVLYLQVEPDICVERIAKRHRKGEEKIDIDFIKKVHKQHEQWLNTASYPVLHINGNGETVDKTPIIAFINHSIGDF